MIRREKDFGEKKFFFLPYKSENILTFGGMRHETILLILPLFPFGFAPVPAALYRFK